MTDIGARVAVRLAALAMMLSPMPWPAPVGAQPAPLPAAPLPTLEVRDPGPGPAGRILRHVAARPHRVVVARDRWATVEAADATSGSVVIVHGSARVDARIGGDVVVVDGDLRLENGARIGGRAVAIGGHVFRSPFAVVQGGVVELPTDRFDAEPVGARWEVRWGPLVSQYGTPPLRLPGLAGLRVTAYSRVDGLALAWGPEVNAGPLTVRPAVTWRSHRGVVDPSLDVRLGSRRVALEASAERTTATADGWIAPDLAAATLGFVTGTDLRNWYRADRASLGLRARQDAWPIVVEGWGAVRAERVEPAAASGALAGPWTLFAPTPGRGFARPNPVVPGGRFTSAIAGVALGGPSGAARGTRVSVQGETSVAPWDTGGRFTQLLADVTSDIPLGLGARLAVHGHGAWASGALPLQRWQAAGGPGTLLTEPVLGLQAPQLVYASAHLSRGLLGAESAPVVGLRAASVTRWPPGGAPARVVNVGGTLDVGPLRLEYAYDPSTRRGVAVLVASFVPAFPAP